MELLTHRYQKEIMGTLSCFDRVVITGTLPHICHSRGMTFYLYQHSIRIFDYADFTKPFNTEIRTNADRLAQEHDIDIEFVRKSSIRKDDLIQRKLADWGTKSGLVHILSAMESCSTYNPWHNKQTHKSYVTGDTSRCLHYYFYFMDELLGLCYIRVPTWCPFRLQIYFNGHNWLAHKLDQAGIGYTLLDNAFVHIDDYDQAQAIADSFDVKELHKVLNRFAAMFCPVHTHFNQTYHWSIMQAEYATDIIFKAQKDLQAIYDRLIKTAMHTVTPDHVGSFLGRSGVHGNYEGEVDSRYQTRIQGRIIKHHMGKAAIKMYDKFGHVLRIETTANDISFFKHYRRVEHRDGTTSHKNTAMKKNIYRLAPLQSLLKASNRRYLEFISTIEDHRIGHKRLNKVSQSVVEQNRSYKGFNIFNQDDLNLLMVIARGEFTISGFQNKHLKPFLKNKKSGQISRMLKRLRTHGLIKKIGNTYKYYLTKLGQIFITTTLKIKEMVMIPELSAI